MHLSSNLPIYIAVKLDVVCSSAIAGVVVVGIALGFEPRTVVPLTTKPDVKLELGAGLVPTGLELEPF